MHDLAPPVEKVSSRQGEQDAALLVEENEPAAQGEHLPLSTNWPGVQVGGVGGVGVQVDEPGLQPWPLGQGVQDLAPPVEKVSLLQGEHEATLLVELNEPAAQGEHLPLSTNCPGVQVGGVGGLGVQVDEPESQPCPEGQGVQDLAPPVEKVSLSQGEHEAALLVELNEPAAQGEHLLLSTNCPGVQVGGVGGLGVQVDEPESQPCPLGQGVHDLAPPVEKVSLPQGEHEAALLVALNEPAAQGEHLLLSTNCPGVQVGGVGGLGVHDDEPELQPCPAGQGEHDLAPPVEKVSLSQGEQDAALLVELNEPAAQGEHLLLSMNCPGVHVGGVGGLGVH